MADETTTTDHRTITFNVLGYREDGEWVALALELDLRGYGPTFETACVELEDLARAQISFALEMGKPEMIWFPAEQPYFDLFSKVRAGAICSASHHAALRSDAPVPRTGHPRLDWKRTQA
jgi:hypothetical protein